MGNVIKLKRTAEPGLAPAPDQIVLGELALNVADGKAFLKRLDGTVVEIGGTPAPLPYDFLWAYSGKPKGNAILFRCPLSRSVTFPAGMVDSRCLALSPGKSASTFYLRRNGVQFGTMRFAAGASSATFTAGNTTIFSAGDLFTITAPTSPDPWLGDLAGSIAGSCGS